MKVVDIIGYRVFSDNLGRISFERDQCEVINTISPNSYGVATKDKAFDNALKRTDYLVLDGIYFAFAALLLKRQGIKPNQGPDVFYHFMNRLGTKGGRVFFLGSTENTLALMEKRTKREYSGITCKSFSPPFKAEFDEADDDAMVSRINDFCPDVLFVGMTCPKQEKWAIRNREKLCNCLVICIGNVFDWYAGTQKPIPRIWFKLGLAWFARIFMRPEIFKRNIGNQMLFFWHVILIFLKIKKI